MIVQKISGLFLSIAVHTAQSFPLCLCPFCKASIVPQNCRCSYCVQASVLDLSSPKILSKDLPIIPSLIFAEDPWTKTKIFWAITSGFLMIFFAYFVKWIAKISRYMEILAHLTSNWHIAHRIQCSGRCPRCVMSTTFFNVQCGPRPSLLPDILHWKQC